ncbi:MAG: hypothetical protein WAX69_22185 [Victivallales bacterium]
MFSIGKEVFMKAISGIGKVIAGKNSLRILSCVRIRSDESGASVSATNIDEHITYGFGSIQGSGTEDIIIEVAALKKFLKGDAGTGDIVFERVQPDMVKVTAEIAGQRIERLFKIEDPENWIVWPEEPKEFQPVKADFFEALHKVFPSASIDESRKILMSAFVHNNSVIATNGSELVVLPCELPKKFEAMIPPTKIMVEGFFRDDAQIAVKMVAGKNPAPERIHVKSGPWHYSVRCPCGNYPNYLQVIPPTEKLTNSVVFGMDGLDALRRAIPCLEGSKEDPVTVLQAGRFGVHLFSQNMKTPYAIKAEGEYAGTEEKFIPMGHVRLLRAFKLGYNRFRFGEEQAPVMATGKVPGFMVFMPYKMPVPKEKLMEYLNNKYQNKEDQVKNAKQTNETAGQVPALAATETVKQPAVPPQANAETAQAEHKSGLTMVGSETDPFDELVKSADELKLKIRDSFEAAAAFQRKIRDAQKNVKAREKSYRNTRELMEKFRTAANF